jgi:hypothetical protein
MKKELMFSSPIFWKKKDKETASEQVKKIFSDIPEEESKKQRRPRKPRIMEVDDADSTGE